jgi:hypothetical protein
MFVYLFAIDNMRAVRSAQATVVITEVVGAPSS